VTPTELHSAAKAQTDLTLASLMAWVARAQRSMDSGKLDGMALARLGELLLNATRYLAEREKSARLDALMTDRATARK